MATWPIASLEELSKQGYLVRLSTYLLQQQALQKNKSWQHKQIGRASCRERV